MDRPVGFRAVRRRGDDAGGDGEKRSRRRTAEDAQREITASAIRFLWEHPFRDLTVGGLMADTTLSRPAFYQYFEDLHHLLETLLAEMDAVLRASANPWVSGEGEPIAALRESLRGVVRVSVDQGPVMRAITEAAPLDERLERAWSTFLAHWDDAVTARIEAQQHAGLVPAFDARLMARALNRLDAAVLIEEFGRRPQGDPELVLGTLHRIWVNTLYGTTDDQTGGARGARRRNTT